MNPTKLIHRREFAKLAGGAALAPALVVLLPDLASGGPATESVAQQPVEAPRAEPALKLTPEQEEAVKRAVERRDRQLAAIRSRTLGYDVEPAFVFQVRHQARPRGRR